MGERRGMKALELWCKRVTDGYQGVKVDNMTTSWRDGLAFCAIIHHFRPDLIDFGALNKDDIHRNNELAFRTAEVHLGIPALLDAEDMVECCVPDRLSILTYLSQFYQTFAGSRQSMSPSPNRTPPVGKRPASPSVLSPVSQTPPSKMMALGPARREPCTACGMPVFIAERLLVGGRKLFHRACFCCARCQHQLSLANCYETEDGHYCCEACPDEVDIKASDSLTSNDENDNNKKSGSLTLDLTKDHNSADFESVVDRALCDRPDSVVEIKQNEQSSNAMSNFMIGQLQCEVEEVLQPFPPSVISEQAKDTSVLVDTDRCSHVNSTSAALDLSNSDINNSLGYVSKDKSSDFLTKTNPRVVVVDNDVEVVPFVGSSIKHNDRGQPLTANDRIEDCDHDQNKLITKCTKESDDAPPSSIVKMRMQMFDHREENTTKIKYSSRMSVVLSKKSEDSVETDRPNSLEPECNVAPMPELVSDISMPDIALPIDQEESEVSDKLEEEVILLPDTPYESNLPSNEVSESENINEQKKLELDHNEINMQVPNFEEHIKPREENVSTDSSSIANVEKIMVPVTHFEHANKVVQAITTNLPVVPSAEYVANSDTVAKETTSEALPDQAAYPSELNPFGDDGESDKEDSKRCAASTNPFGSDDNDDEHLVPAAKGKPPRPPQPASRQSDKLPKVSVNPFWSDGEEPSSEEETSLRRVPIPRPRTLLNVSTPEPTPKVRLDSSTGRYGSTNSLSSTDSSRNSTTHRKKKHAPPPPLPSSSPPPPLPRSAPPRLSPSPSPVPSPKSLPRQPRKARPAPAPPAAEPPRELKKITVSPAIESEKFEKDETNRHRQSWVTRPATEQTLFTVAANKSMYGQWKRKKGPAPPRPVPQRREIRAMPMKEVKRELDDIDVQQLGLERQGVCLEKMIRSKFEETTPTEGEVPSGVTPDVEDLILQLFEIVNEKNELFRRQAELMYLRRQHRLEEEHADLEYQIRCLLEQPDHAKTDTEKAYEEDLIRRLVDVVERRDEIVNCLEMDRRREAEEDRSIHEQLAVFADCAEPCSHSNSLLPSNSLGPVPVQLTAKGKDGDANIEAGTTVTHKKNALKLLKKKVKKSKEKLSKKKEVNNGDADKDIDESDAAGKQAKDKKSKHKWF